MNYSKGIHWRLRLPSLPLLLALSLARAESTSCLINFNESHCGHFSLLPSVIFKSALSKVELETRLERPLQQLAMLGDAGLFLAADSDPVTYAKTLARRSDIIYAQPDLTQKRRVAALTPAAALPVVDIPALWATTRGAGVKVAIIDDGFDLTHEAFRKTHITFAYDADRKLMNAIPKLLSDHHGTPVAGLIFAAHDDRGAEGIAPEAEMIAIRQPSNRTSATVLAFTVADMAGADIIVCSWNSPMLMEPVRDAITHLARHGRNGLGTAIVFAAGNEGRQLTPLSVEAAIPEVITVATKSRFSNHGPMVDFTIPDTYLSTTAKGYAPFSGTSAAAPVVGGLLALAMARDPQLPLDQLVVRLQGALHERGE